MTKTNPIELQKKLKGVDYPADRQELIKHAQTQGASRDILSLLEKLPENQKYDSPANLNKAIGKIW